MIIVENATLNVIWPEKVFIGRRHSSPYKPDELGPTQNTWMVLEPIRDPLGHLATWVISNCQGLERGKPIFYG